MRIMYDAIDALQLPTGGDLYAGYVDGHWPSANAISERFPTKPVVRIAVSAATNDGVVLDVETGDATPAEAVNWVLNRRHAGVDPTVYCNLSTWATVRSAFQTHDVPEPHYWIADYVTDPSQPPTAVPSGTVGVQWYDFRGYDQSLIGEYWPGVDPAPIPPVSPTIVLEEEPVQIEPLSVHPGDYAIAFAPDKKQLVFVADGDNGAPAELRVAVWVGNSPSVIPDLKVGGSAGHSVGHTLPAGCTGVTIKRQDAGAFAVGIAAQ